MEHIGYLLAVFLITWALLFLYVIRLTLKERRLRREIASLNQAQKPTFKKEMDKPSGPRR